MERITRQRRAILDAFEQAGRPLGPGEVWKTCKRKVKTLNLATVYRNLKALLEREDLVMVEVTGQPPRYELAALPHHHHFLCESCDRVYDVAGCPKDIRRMAPRGFKVSGHELMFRGMCRGCAA